MGQGGQLPAHHHAPISRRPHGIIVSIYLGSFKTENFRTYLSGLVVIKPPCFRNNMRGMNLTTQIFTRRLMTTKIGILMNYDRDMTACRKPAATHEQTDLRILSPRAWAASHTRVRREYTTDPQIALSRNIGINVVRNWEALMSYNVQTTRRVCGTEDVTSEPVI